MDSASEAGLRLPVFTEDGTQVEYDELVEYVKEAKGQGFTSFWSVYQLLTGDEDQHAAWDPLPTLSSLSADVDDVLFGPLVLPLPLEHPVQAAKKYATLDRVSDGRLVLGVGTGWNPAEFNALGLSKKNRGKRCEESIEVMKKLWSQNNVSYEGDLFEIEDVTLHPKPTDGNVPIWIGGGRYAREQLVGEPNPPTVSRVLKRIARIADGWVPHAPNNPELVKQDYTEIEEYCEEFGRDVDDVTISYNNFIYAFESDDEQKEYDRARDLFTQYSDMDWDDLTDLFLVGQPEDLVEQIEQRVEATDGVDHVILNPVTRDSSQLEVISNEVIDNL